MIERKPDWPELLAEYIEQRRHVPFAWGGNDCVLFAVDCVLHMTGTDIASAYRGTYEDARGAATILSAAGGIRGLAEQVHLTERLKGLAQRGDMALIDMEGRETLTIVAGNGFVVGPGERGIAYRPMAEVQVVYAI